MPKIRWTRDALGVLPGVLGSIGMMAGIAIYFSYLYVARSKMSQFLTVDSSAHPQFASWMVGDHGANIAETVLFAANITNPDAVLAGRSPTIEFVGPFRYALQRVKHNVFFSEDAEFITFNQSSFYTSLDPSDASAVMVTLNAPIVGALEHLHAAGLGDAALASVFASAGLRDIGRCSEGPIRCAAEWSSNASLCYGGQLTGACSLAHFFSSTGSANLFDSLSDIEVHRMLLSLSNQADMIRFVAEAQGLIAQNSSAVPAFSYIWSEWRLHFDLTIIHLQDLLSYLLATGSSIMAEMQARYCLPQSILFTRSTAREFFFTNGPFEVFLGGDSLQSPLTCLFCNGTSLRNVVRTGRRDEAFMGTDYFVELAGVGDRVGGIAVDGSSVQLSLAGRTQSLQPFIYENPTMVDIRLPLVHRRVKYTFSGSASYRSLAVRRYEMKLDKYLESDFVGALGLDPFFGLPLAVSRVGLRGAGIHERIWDQMCPLSVSGFDHPRDSTRVDGPNPINSVHDLLNEPLGYFHAEQVSGYGVDNQFSGQLNVVLNWSKVNWSYLGMSFGSSLVLENNLFGEAQSLTFVPQTILLQRSYANAESAAFLNHQLNELLDVFRVVFIASVSVSAVLLALSMAWVAWDTHGAVVLQGTDT